MTFLPIFSHFLAGFFGAIGQYFYKRGGNLLGQIPIWKNYQLFLGVLSFCIVMVLFVLSYKWGGKISTVYPFYATTFIWGAILGYWLDGESIAWPVYLGCAFIILGISIIGFGAKT